MNTWLMAERFRAWFEDYSEIGLSASGYRHEQDEQRLTEPAYPAVIFNAEAEPFSSDGKTASCVITVTVISRSPPYTAEQHSNLVASVAYRLIEGKGDVIAQINGLAEFGIVGYSASTDKMAFDGDRFATPITLRATIRQL